MRAGILAMTILIAAGVAHAGELATPQEVSMALQPRYGFRTDPMAFVENDRIRQGALVRTFVFGCPVDGDAEQIAEKVDKLLAAQARGEQVSLSGPLVTRLCPAEGGIWHDDVWAPVMLKSDLAGGFLDFGEKPFNGKVGGLAFDGTSLWALDAAGGRICILHRSR